MHQQPSISQNGGPDHQLTKIKHESIRPLPAKHPPAKLHHNLISPKTEKRIFVWRKIKIRSAPSAPKKRPRKMHEKPITPPNGGPDLHSMENQHHFSSNHPWFLQFEQTRHKRKPLERFIHQHADTETDLAWCFLWIRPKMISDLLYVHLISNEGLSSNIHKSVIRHNNK